ncbi:GNAT family N-acetyltransferase [Aliivibrio fischeri]|uniref:GNAT family N-acetyltransferase n=1 Tax=Aliivibrio fischeri TaxID=668 RepID=UPI001F2E0574|nr:GNAT family N-acetyltransferase [Aliivibrio fischeri]MCE4937550.1 GNAT family N-acetyltransferase [Aliivibrio fischeri]
MEIIYLNSTDEMYQQVLNLRYDLFFRERGLPREILFDALEENSTHVAIIEQGDLYAYGRLSETAKGIFKISQMVVKPKIQGKGLGSRVLSELVNSALEKGAKEVFLNARLHAVSMYGKIGFETVGSSFIAKGTGVPHIKMVKCC